jgi:hypothetical protein
MITRMMTFAALALGAAFILAGCEEQVDPEACAAAAQLFDFEDDEQGFMGSSTDSGFGNPWEFGDPYYTPCHSPDHCWATILFEDYHDCEAGGVFSPDLDLSPCAGSAQAVQLKFWHLFRMEEDYNGTWYDGAAVFLSGDGGGSWQTVSPSTPYSGTIEGNYEDCEGTPEIEGHEGWSGIIGSDDWTEVVVDVDDALRTEQFRVRFLFGTDRGSTDEGWYIDDVEIAVAD